MKHNCILKHFEVKNSGKFSFNIYNRASDVPVTQWENTIEADKVFFNLNYLNALENSNPVALHFRYVIFFENQQPIACFSFQLLNVASKDLGNILNLDKYGWLAGKVTNAIDKMVFKRSGNQANYIICCGSFFVSGEYGITFRDKNKKSIICQSIPQVIEAIKSDVENSGNDICAVIVKDFFDASSIENVLIGEGFSSLPMDPEMIFHVNKNWNSFEDYLNSLSAKYRLRSNNSLKKLEKVIIRFLSQAEIEKFKNEMYELYLQVQQNASVRLVKAGPDYFANLQKMLPGNFYVKAFFLDNKMIAFMSGIHFNGSHEAHLIGMEYSMNKSLLIYQNILYSFIKDAIELKSAQLFFGRTALEIKTTVGAKAYPLHTYFRMNNSLLNGMIKPLVKRSKQEEWTPRDPYKKEA